MKGEDNLCCCDNVDCECTDESHAAETVTYTNDSLYHCTNHWVRVAYEKTSRKVGWPTWKKMVHKVMEDLIEYFWNYTSLDEYQAAWEEEIEDKAEPERSLQLCGYIERLKKLVAAGFNPKHSYDVDEGLWMWA